VNFSGRQASPVLLLLFFIGDLIMIHRFGGVNAPEQKRVSPSLAWEAEVAADLRPHVCSDE